MKVRFVRTCASKGIHYEVGTIADLPEREVRDLISARRVVRLENVVENRDPTFAIGDAADTIIGPPKRRQK